MSLRLTAFKGIRWNFVAMVIATLGGLVQIYLLVRFLEKSDFGIMAIINAIIAFFMIFVGYGVDNSIIHKEKISSSQLSTLYWLTLFLGSIMTIIVYFMSSLIALFFGEAGLEQGLKVIAAVFFINSLGYPLKAKLSKELYFKELSIISIAGNLSAIIITISLAMQGFGVYALIYGTLLKSLIDTILSFRYGFKIYELKFLFILRDVDFFLRFGLFQVGENILNFLSKQIDIFIIGKFLGMEMLGIYDVIKKLLQRPLFMINPIITNVSFPLMSKFQNDISRLTEVYLRQLNYICALNFPIYIFLFINADLVIELIFGADWLAHKTIFCIISLNFLLASSLNPIGSLLMAKGKVDLSFYWNLGLFFIGPAVIFYGVQWGLTGVAISTFLLYLFLIIPNYSILVRAIINPGFKPYFRQILLPLLLSLIMGACCYIISTIIDFPPVIQILLLAIVAATIYSLQTYWFNRKLFSDALTLIKKNVTSTN